MPIQQTDEFASDSDKVAFSILPQSPNVRNVVVSGQAAFISNVTKATLRSAYEPTAANEGTNLLPE